MTDRELLETYVSTGSDAAFEELVRRHADAVYSISYHLLRSVSAAEDAVQATFLVLAKKARALDKDVVLAGWLVSTARYCAQDIRRAAMRRQKNEREVSQRRESQLASAPELSGDTLAVLSECIALLPAQQRDVVILRYLQNRSQADTAAEMGCAVQSVSAALSKALAKLRALLSQRGVALSGIALTDALTQQCLLCFSKQAVGTVALVATGKAVASAVSMQAANAALRGSVFLKATVAAGIGVALIGASAAVLSLPSARQPVNVATGSQALAPLTASSASSANDLVNLPINTWVRLNTPRVLQPVGYTAGEQGQWTPAGWNKLVYNRLAKSVLFYDRWADARHGGYSSYGNCLFEFDPLSGRVVPLKLDNWKIEENKTVALAVNQQEPTPWSRQACQAFEFVPALASVFITNGANHTAVIDGRVNAQQPETWRLHLADKKWVRLKSDQHPPVQNDTAMAYCPEVNSIVYVAQKVWILDLATGQWRPAKQSPPTGGLGQTICYDPRRKRMLLGGGGQGQYTHPSYKKLYAFDVLNETVSPLAECPTAQYGAPLAYNAKHDLFVMAYAGRDLPTGTFAYDPNTDRWDEVKTQNAAPASRNWYGWIRLCYAVDYDCFIGCVHTAAGEQFYAFRYAPP